MKANGYQWHAARKYTHKCDAIRYDTMHMPCYVLCTMWHTVDVFHKRQRQTIILLSFFWCDIELSCNPFLRNIYFSVYFCPFWLHDPIFESCLFLSSCCSLTLIYHNINYSAKQINSFRVHKYCEQTLVTNYHGMERSRGGGERYCVNVEPWHLLSHNWFILSMYFPDYQSFIYAWEWCTNNRPFMYIQKMSEREKESILWVLCSRPANSIRL